MFILKPVANPFARKGLSARRRRMYDFLQEHPVGVISTIGPDGVPHGAVVYFAIDESLTAHILTKKGTRKYDNLRHDGRTQLTVFDLPTQTTVQFTGRATEREGATETKQTAQAIFAASSQTSTNGLPPIVKLQAGAFTCFQIHPVQIRMAIYARPESGDYNDLFDTVETFDLND